MWESRNCAWVVEKTARQYAKNYHICSNDIFVESCCVVAGNRYDLVMMPVVNGVAKPTVTVTAYS